MAQNEKTAVFGGTFNPVHNGHIKLLKNFSEAVDFDRILIVPSGIPPHKEAHGLISGEKRAQMCRLAFEEFENAEVCECEIRRGGVSYTYETLKYLKKKYPESTLYFLMGTDMLMSFKKWYRYKDIAENAVLLCGRRDGETSEAELVSFAENEIGLSSDNFIVSKAEPFEISSSRIREMISRSEDISAYVPKKVAEFIDKEGLYEE